MLNWTALVPLSWKSTPVVRSSRLECFVQHAVSSEACSLTWGLDLHAATSVAVLLCKGASTQLETFRIFMRMLVPASCPFVCKEAG